MMGRAVISMGALVALCLAGRAADDLVDKYVKMWNEQREEIVSAHIKFKWFRGAGTEFMQPLSPQQIKTLFETAQLEADRAQLETLLEKLVKPGKSVRPLARDGELWIEGKRFREELHGPDGSLAVTNVYDGENEISARPGNPILVHNPGGSQIGAVTLTDFRHLPRFPDGATWVAEEVGNETITMRHVPNEKFKGRSFMYVDQNSGRVFYSEARSEQEIRRQRFQGRDRTFRGGISLPSYSAQVDYTGNPPRLSWIQICYVLDATFNASIGEDRFRVQMPQGARVLDFRTQPPRSIVDSPVASTDVLAALNQQAGLPAPPARGSLSYWKIALTMIVGLAVALIGHRVYRSRRAT